MERIIRSITFVVVLCALVLVAECATADPSGKTILIDFRAEYHDMQYQDYPEASTIQLLSEMGVDHYYKDEKECAEDDFETKILDSAIQIPVHFTKQTGEQNLVLLHLKPCNQPYWDVEVHLFFFVKGKKMGELHEGCVNVMTLVPSAPGSDTQVAVTLCGGMGQGVAESSSAMIGYQDGQLKQIADLGLVQYSNCGAGDDGVDEASVVSVDSKGNRTIENYRRGCDSKAEYKKFSTGPLQEEE